MRARRDLIDQSSRLTSRQSVEGEERDVRERRPRRNELRTEGNHEQDRATLDTVDNQIEELLRGWIQPMRVFEDHQDRLPLRQAFELTQERLERAHLTLRRRKFERRIAVLERQAK